MTNVVVAPDKFRGSLSAERAARQLAAGILDVCPDVPITSQPLADGGEGTVAALVAGGRYRLVPVVLDEGARRSAVPVAVNGRTVVVELGLVAGWSAVRNAARPNPMTASTERLGLLVTAVLDELRPERIVLAVGGNVSTDGGAGLIQHLGARLLDAAGAQVGAGGQALAQVARVDLRRLSARVADVRFTVAHDVDNPLLGSTGTVAAFASQKGATVGDRAHLTKAIENWAFVTAQTTGRDVSTYPGAGAAGGTGFGAYAYLDADHVVGADFVMAETGVLDCVAAADVVVTGRGALTGNRSTARCHLPSHDGHPRIAPWSSSLDARMWRWRMPRTPDCARYTRSRSSNRIRVDACVLLPAS